MGPKVNHSCSPNCGVRLNDSGACDFVAREPIEAGEQITFDYAMRNYSVEHFPGGCLCGSDTRLADQPDCAVAHLDRKRL
jgi:uncharacterized protein